MESWVGVGQNKQKTCPWFAQKYDTIRTGITCGATLFAAKTRPAQSGFHQTPAL